MSWQKPVYEDNPFSETFDRGASTNSSLLLPKSAEVPPWLQESKSPSPSPSQVPSQGQSQGSLPLASPVSAENTSLDVPKLILYTRVANLVLSICMIVASLLSLLTTNNATTGVLACYVVVFSCLLCCFETHLKQISKFIALNFGFMYSAKSRTAFMIFVGTILFSFSLFGKLVGCLMIVNAFANIYILVKHPQFDDAQRTDAQVEIKDFLASNPAFAQQIFSLGVQSGASIIASNPDLSKQVVGSFVSNPPSTSSSV